MAIVRKRVWLHVLLAFLMVWAQHVALAHAASHLTAPAKSDQAPADSRFCDKCLLCAHLGDAVTSPILLPQLGTPGIIEAAQAPSDFASRFHAVFLSRAPPAVL